MIKKNHKQCKSLDNIYCIVSIGRNLNFTFDNFILFEYFSLIIYKKIKFITPVDTNIEISFNTVDMYFACSQRQCIQKRCVHCRSVVYVDWLGWWLTDSYLYTISEIDGCVTLSKRTGKNVSNRLYIPNARNRHKKPFLIFYFFLKSNCLFLSKHE